MLTMAIKPGHDGSIALVEDGQLLWCLESEKDTFPRYTQLTPTTVLAAAELLDRIPDVVALGGWAKPRGGGPIGAGYSGRLNGIKQREDYRPIAAPCCREEDLAEAFVEDFPDPYMLYFRRVRSPRLRAVTHVDGSARVQSVTPVSNPQLHRLLDAFAGETGLGVLCNTSLNLRRRGFINRMSDLIRLHEIIGQHEDAGPLLWWLDRMRRSGPVLVPAPDRAIQPIDVRDVSRFMVDLVQQRATGVINVAAPAEGRTYGAMVRACAKVVAGDQVAEPELVWVDEDWLADQGVRQRTELPLWSKAAAPWDVCVDRAVAAGLQCRPLIDTAADTWRWLASGVRKCDHPRIAQYGIDPVREADIIARWRAKAADPGGSRPLSGAR